MKTVNKYKNILLEWFYLHEDGTVRRAKDGYHGKYKKDDIVIPYKLCTHGYAGVHVPTKRTTVSFHHLITLLRGIEIPDDSVIDHINGDGLDNSEQNIRITTQSINCRNRRKRRDNTSGINGITFNKASNSYLVRVCINGKRVYLGSKNSLEEANKLLHSYDSILESEGYTKRHHAM
jgi:hypothetical protein